MMSGMAEATRTPTPAPGTDDVRMTDATRTPTAAPGTDCLTIAGRTFQSRLLLGTGGFSSHQLLTEAIEASGSELVTVALRRIDPAGLKAGRGSLVDVLTQAGVEVLRARK